MQAALNEGASQAPATPRPSIERQHLSPTPAPATDGINPRRRRSSSALKQPRHEVCDEEPPTNRFHQPEFQNAFRDAKQLIADLSAVLATGSLHQEPDTTMKKLYEDSVALSSFRCPETRTIGFVGASGVGKSSL
jgi:ABC-type glutathione transport system ATPase component